jgi:hypothetical protein
MSKSRVWASFFWIMPLAQTRLPDGGQAWHAKDEYKEPDYEIL